VAIAVSSVTS